MKKYPPLGFSSGIFGGGGKSVKTACFDISAAFLDFLPVLRSFWSTRVFRATVVYPSWRALLKTDKQIGRKRWIVENDIKSLAKYTST